MSFARRFTIVTVVAALLCALAYGVGWASQAGSLPWQGPVDDASTPAQAGEDPPGVPEDLPTTEPVDEATDDRSEEPSNPDQPTDEPEGPTVPELTPGPALIAPGDSGDEVHELQARLAQIDWFNADVTGYYGDVTTEAVRGFQAKREIPVTGEVDRRTLDRLHSMTNEPTPAELTNQTTTNAPGALDPRCLDGRVICVDKTSNTLRWVVDGEVLKTMDARFGGSATPTREGEFSVFQKSRDHVSSLYDTSMPFAMFFSNGQAVHYSPDFASVGYDGASHGCVNTRDYDGVAWLYDQVQIGDTVVVYWS
ncbi:L,D-transpeptidase family protein [Nocardioides sp. HM23]|uniref:L,D-transpeptidase family protein n=1 Tax=Nocardioides bizhenqiangii TaxID=3095076 RepID=UPI002ACA9DD3|nr:L,D-transpeptidase family protein [Nocardioides sp. HM23]MDZ5622731.1 L,D-transpeptidase family protein [Nocardioides sp. HM23]